MLPITLYYKVKRFFSLFFFSKSFKLESGKVAKWYKNDSLKILAQSVKVLRLCNGTFLVKESMGINKAWGTFSFSVFRFCKEV